MRKYLLFILLVSTSFGQIIATTEDGKKVLLESNGTWKFSEDAPKKVDEGNSIWKVKYYVDDFGDFTDNGYITTDVLGKFSNSATTNSELGVRFIIDDDVAIKLFEYNRNHSVSGKISTKTYLIHIKHNGKRLPSFTARNFSDRLIVDKKGSKDLITIFKMGGSFTFKIIEDTNYSSSDYLFKIEDASGFKIAWNQLFNK